MAPKGMKRPAAAEKNVSVKKQCRSVADALSQSELPSAVVQTLKLAAPFALSSYAEERHPMQVQIVKMVGDALSGIETGLKKAVADHSATLAGRDAEKDAREAAILQAGKNLVTCKTAAAAKEYEVYEANLASKKASDALKEKVKAQKIGDKPYVLVAEQVADYEAMKKSATDMKAVKNDAKSCAKLVKQLKGFGADVSLVDSLHLVFGKEPVERGEFDTTITDKLDAELAAGTAKLAAKLQEEEPGRAARAAATETAQAAHDAAKEKLTSLKAELSNAEKHVTEAEKAVEAAQNKSQNFESEMNEVEGKLAAAEKDLADFTSDALGSFASLKVRSPPAPEPEPAAAPETAVAA